MGAAAAAARAMDHSYHTPRPPPHPSSTTTGQPIRPPQDHTYTNVYGLWHVLTLWCSPIRTHTPPLLHRPLLLQLHTSITGNAINTVCRYQYVKNMNQNGKTSLSTMGGGTMGGVSHGQQRPLPSPPPSDRTCQRGRETETKSRIQAPTDIGENNNRNKPSPTARRECQTQNNRKLRTTLSTLQTKEEI